MWKFGFIIVLFVFLFSFFIGCDNSFLDKKVKEEVKWMEKEKGLKLIKMSMEFFN